MGNWVRLVSRSFAFGLIGGLSASCSLLVIDVDERQCRSTPDCEALGAAFAGATCERGVCVLPSSAGDGGEGAGGAPSDEPQDPLVCKPPKPNESDTVVYSFAPIFLAGTAPSAPEPFRVRACDAFDFDCERPLVGPVEVEPGVPFDFELPKGDAGFAGYFQIENPDTLSGLLFMGRPILEDTIGWNVTMPSRNLVAQLAALTMQDLAPELGLILTVARDCQGEPLADVTVSNSKGGLGYYFISNFPDTSLERTGPQGAAGFANVPILPTSLSGVLPSGQELGPVAVRVKPGFMSFAELFP